MKIYTKKQLQTVLGLHKMWREGKILGQRANLRDANLQDADLQGANLRDANFREANLREANINTIRDDFFSVLEVAQNEALGLYDALMRGNIDGFQYQGECACLVGTIANLRHESYRALKISVKPDLDRASERWFLAINKGDFPQNNPVSDITAEWMRAWFDGKGIKYPGYEIVAKWL